MASKKSFLSRLSSKQKLSLFFFAVLLLAFPLIVLAVKFQQDFRSRAYTPSPIITTSSLPSATQGTKYEATVLGIDSSGYGNFLSMNFSGLPTGLSKGPCQISAPATDRIQPSITPIPPISTTPTPKCTPRPNCIEGEPKNDGRVYCALIGAPPSGTVYCPPPTPTCVPQPPCPKGATNCQVPPPPSGTSYCGAGCYYKQVQCVKAPCNPVLVCPPTSTPTPIVPTQISCLITGVPTTPGTFKVIVTLSNSQTKLSATQALPLSVFLVTSITPTPSCKPRPACLDSTPRCQIPETSDMCPRPTRTPTPTTCIMCPPPPVNCTYVGGSCSSCGTLSCQVTRTPTPPTRFKTPTPIIYRPN